MSEWAKSADALSNAKSLLNKIDRDGLLVASRTNTDLSRELRPEIDRVVALYKSNRQKSFEETFDTVLTTGDLPPNYPGETFAASEYASSSAFQSKVTEILDRSKSDVERAEIVKKLSRFIATSTLSAQELQKAKARLLADKRIDLSELPEINRLAKEHGALSGLEGLVKVGYVDLTATSFRNRNLFDFEIEFKKDYGISLVDAKETLLGTGKLNEYDFVFVVDLSAAKIFREFKNKRDVSSQVQTGTRQEQNPEYVEAAAEYQTALAEMQKTKVQNAISGSQPCYGNVWACAIAAGLRGASDGIAASNVKKATERLASTNPTVSKPVFSGYSYQLVDIDAAKVARVDYYVIDTKQKVVYSSYFDIKNHEKFVVSYNVNERDPDRGSILKNNQTEADVTNWEKKSVTVNLSDLFDTKNLQSAQKKPFTSSAAFLQPLTSRKFIPAKPVYEDARSSGASSKSAKNSESQQGNSIIADSRFDSVVIVKNSASIGAGFYVTPELVITAHHVVDKANLVELTFFDGTKTYGKVIDHDVRLDLALIKAQMSGKPVKIHSGPIKLGETVEAIGHPKGYEFTITRGVVSALRKHRSASVGSSAPVEFVQTDTPISPGNSGGPLFLRDVVVGVNDWIRVDKGSQNLNFSVSYNELRSYLDRHQGQGQ